MTIERIGYRGHNPESFVAALKALAPDLVVDCRHKPWARVPEFSKTGMARMLTAAGMAYEHWPGLGNLLYKSAHGVQIAEPAAIARVHELAKTQRVVLVCACQDGKGCHTENIISGDFGSPGLL